MWARITGFAVLALSSAIAILLAVQGLAHDSTVSGQQAVVTSSAQGSSQSQTQTKAQTGGQQAQKPQASTLHPTKVLLKNTPYGSYALQIYPGALSQNAQSALAGFQFKTQPLPGGTVKVSLVLLGQNQTYNKVISPTDRAYFIETSFGDDAPSEDLNLGDDGILYTNAKGFLLQ